jgi:hypothetical protein
MPARRGTPTARVKAGIMERDTVGIPEASSTLWTSPTDRQQNGQAGTSAAASTPRAAMSRAMAGAVSLSSTAVRSWYPMIE